MVCPTLGATITQILGGVDSFVYSSVIKQFNNIQRPGKIAILLNYGDLYLISMYCFHKFIIK